MSGKEHDPTLSMGQVIAGMGLGNIKIENPEQGSYEEGDLFEEKEKTRKLFNTYMRQAEAPKRHQAFKIKDNVSKEWKGAFETVLELVMEKEPMIALIGPRGTGKTQLAVSIMQHFIWKKKATARYIKAMEFFMGIKGSYASHDSEVDAIERFVKPSMLILDEIQVRGSTDWENMMLTHLLDKRYDNTKCTIIIGNLNEEGFIECVGDSVYDRLVETGGVLECKWKSFRI